MERVGRLPGVDADAALLQDWGAAHLAVNRVTARLFAAVTAGTGLSRPMAEVLLRLTLKPDDCVPMSELARVSDYTAGGMSKLADRLVRAGLAERVTEPGDRRLVMIRLTAEGGDAAARVRRLAAAELREQVVGPVGDTAFAGFVAQASRLRARPAERFS